MTAEVPNASRWRAGSRPKLGSKVRLQWDPTRGQAMLLYPEGVLVLNPTAHAVLELCDGTRELRALVHQLAGRYDGAAAAPSGHESAAAPVDDSPADRERRVERDVLRFLERIDARGWLLDAAEVEPPAATPSGFVGGTDGR